MWELIMLEAEPTILRGLVSSVFSVAFSPVGRWLASGCGDSTVRLWVMINLEAELTILNGNEAIVYAVAFSPDGRWLASGSGDSTVRLWDMNNREAELTILSGQEYERFLGVDGQGCHRRRYRRRRRE
jgi:WD40 repeat protein